MLLEKLPTFWWLKNIRYFAYMIREFTGVVIFAYVLYFLIEWSRDPEFLFFETPRFFAFTLITFLFALYHSVTWFLVTVKLLPLNLAMSFLALIVLWGAISYLLLLFFYIPP